MSNTLYEIQVKIGADSSGLDSGLKTAETKTKSTIDKLQGYIKKGFAGLNNVVNTGIKAATAAVTAAGSALLTMGINYNRQIEDYTTNFATMLGSMEEGAAKVNELKTLAAETPFELTDLADATQTLLAFNVSSSQSTTVLRQLGDISLGNAQKLETLTRAYGKMSSSQKVTLEDINMMIDAGFNPLLIVAEETGESMSELYDRISSGEMAFSEIESAIRQATSAGGQFYKGMENASKTLSGQWSTLTDNIRATMGLLATPINDALTGHILPAANEAVNEIYEKLQQIMGESAGTPAGVEQITTNAYDWMSRLVASWSDGLQESNDLVASYISEFQEDSENLRTALQERKELYEESGQDTSTIDGYLTKLDEYDKELEELLQKRQNQMLTPEETARIEEIVTLKNEIADFLNMEAANTSLQGIVTNLGDIIGIKVADWINGFKDWLLWAMDNGEQVRERCIAIGLGLAAIKTALIGLAAIGTPYGTIMLLVAAIAALAAVIADNWSEITTGLNAIWEAAKDPPKLRETLKEALVIDTEELGAEATGREIADQINAGLEEGGQGWVATVNEGIMQVLSVLATGETLDGTSFDSAMLGLLDKAFGTEWQAKWDEVKANGQVTWEEIGKSCSDTWDETIRIWGGIGQWFWNNFNAPIGRAAVDAWNGIMTGASTAWNGVQSAWNTAESWFSGIWDDIGRGAETLWANIGGWIDGAIASIKNFLGLNADAEKAASGNFGGRTGGSGGGSTGSGADGNRWSSSGGVGRSYATGLDYVPYDGFAAVLHEGEAVLTKLEAQNWRRGGTSTLISGPSVSAADIANAVAAAISGMRVVMDGESVGTIVAPYVSASQGESLRARRNTL